MDGRRFCRSTANGRVAICCGFSCCQRRPSIIGRRCQFDESWRDRVVDSVVGWCGNIVYRHVIISSLGNGFLLQQSFHRGAASSELVGSVHTHQSFSFILRQCNSRGRCVLYWPRHSADKLALLCKVPFHIGLIDLWLPLPG